MAEVPSTFGSGGSGVPPAGSSSPSLKDILWDEADDLETVRTKFNALLAKLDADAGVTDVDYASTLGIASGDIKTKKGT